MYFTIQAEKSNKANFGKSRVNEKTFVEWFNDKSVNVLQNENKTFISERKSKIDLTNIDNNSFISEFFVLSFI